MWMSDSDPIKQQELEKMPLLEYWHRLTKKMEETEKAIATKRKQLRESVRTNSH
jgi:hypothetical protein